MPVNWATTIERKPVAFEPSACIPFIPKTDLRETLKIYGDADVTVSELNVSVEPDTFGSGFCGIVFALYVISVSLFFSHTTYCPSYPAAVTSSILNGVSTSRLSSAVVVVTVIVEDEITPSPALILLIPTDSPMEPTIRYSSIFFSISMLTLGYSGEIVLPD